MHKVHIGIDPGISGCVAVIEGDAVTLYDTPSIEGKTKTKSKVTGKPKIKRMYDEVAMARLLKPYTTRMATVTIEQVNAMPKRDPITHRVVADMGVTSMFNFGFGFGLWVGIIAALEFPSLRVHPARWKKIVLEGAPRVDTAPMSVASRLYPQAASQLRGPRGGILLDRAHALCIAHYGILVERAAGLIT